MKKFKPLSKNLSQDNSGFISATTEFNPKKKILGLKENDLVTSKAKDKFSEPIATNIYNKKNILIQKKDIIAILKSLDVPIKRKIDLPLFQMAMTHLSYIKKNFTFVDSNDDQDQNKIVMIKENNDDCVELREESNQRLEFLGDAVLHLIIAEYLYDRYPTANEGFMTKLRIGLEKGETVAKFAHSIGLEKFILISEPVEKAGGRTNCKVMEDAFEAFVGALRKNYGFHACKKFIIHILETRINIAQFINIDTNFKDQLLRYFHQQHWGDPIYQELKHDFNQQTFENKFKVCVKDVKDKIFGTGDGINKKKAEQMAAKQALLSLGAIEEDSDDDE
jgi:dsRNA-specific ribonuclease